jgi:DNA-binding MarR family transcriptional regulator
MSNKTSISGKLLSEITTYQVGALESAAHRALRQYKDGLLSSYDLSGMDWYIIGAVNDAGSAGIRTTDLAQTLGTTLGFLTKSLKLLEAKKIVSRKANAKDARSSYIVLQPHYQKTVREIESVLRTELRKTFYSSIDRADLEAYIRVMETFSKFSNSNE